MEFWKILGILKNCWLFYILGHLEHLGLLGYMGNLKNMENLEIKILLRNVRKKKKKKKKSLEISTRTAGLQPSAVKNEEIRKKEK